MTLFVVVVDVFVPNLATLLDIKRKYCCAGFCEDSVFKTDLLLKIIN